MTDFIDLIDNEGLHWTRTERYAELTAQRDALLSAVKAALHILDRNACFVDNELRIVLEEYRHGSCPRVLGEALMVLKRAVKSTNNERIEK